MTTKRSSVAGLMAACLSAAPALAQPPLPAPSSLPSITVVGEAQVQVAPDLVRIEAGVSNMARSAQSASEAGNLAIGKVLLELKNAGIDGKDIQTSRLSLQPQYASNRPGPSEITGYLASNIVTVRLREVSRTAAVVDTLVGAGANEIRGISFSVSDASNRLDEARGQAIADARRKAEIYARAAGVTLGAPLTIAEDTHSNAIPLRRIASDFAARTQVSPGEETLGVTVIVNWAIKTP
jgi:uncharacterized protein